MSGTTVLTPARCRVCTTLLMVRSVGESVHRQERSTGGVINHRDGVVRTLTLNGTNALLAMTVQGINSSSTIPYPLYISLIGITRSAWMIVLPVSRISSGAIQQGIPGTTAALLYLTLQPRQ